MLVRQGFRVVAPDMRGYNLSDKPTGVAAYRVERLAAEFESDLGALTQDERGRLTERVRAIARELLGTDD